MKVRIATSQVRCSSGILRTVFCLGALFPLVSTWSPCAIAQTTAEISSDAAEVGRVQAFRAQLLKKKNANEISAAEYGREDYAADSIVVHLNDKYSYRGTITNTFLAQANQVSQAILANPAAHQAELDQAAADVEKEAGSVAQMDQEIIDQSKKLATQPPPTAAPRSNNGIPMANDGVRRQTTPAAISKPGSPGSPIAGLAITLVLLAIGAGAWFLFHLKRRNPATVAYVEVKVPPPVPPPTSPPVTASQAPASCQKCGARWPPGAVACPNCGQGL